VIPLGRGQVVTMDDRIGVGAAALVAMLFHAAVA
jgi:hypothetical protein